MEKGKSRQVRRPRCGLALLQFWGSHRPSLGSGFLSAVRGLSISGFQIVHHESLGCRDWRIHASLGPHSHNHTWATSQFLSVYILDFHIRFSLEKGFHSFISLKKKICLSQFSLSMILRLFSLKIQPRFPATHVFTKADHSTKRETGSCRMLFASISTSTIKNMNLLSIHSCTMPHGLLISTSKVDKFHFQFERLSDFTDFENGKSW